jgi:hypothetical protein
VTFKNEESYKSPKITKSETTRLVIRCPYVLIIGKSIAVPNERRVQRNELDERHKVEQTCDEAGDVPD